MFLLREGELFPLILSLPTGSMREFSRYIKRLLSKGKKSNMVVTRFSLKKATKNSGIAYSQAQFSIDRPLTTEEQLLITKLSEQVKGYSRRVGFDAEEPAETDVPFVDPETGEQWYADVDNYSPGFSVGVLGEMRLNTYLSLRLVPTLHFGQKHVSFHEQRTGQDSTQNLSLIHI